MEFSAGKVHVVMMGGDGMVRDDLAPSIFQKNEIGLLRKDGWDVDEGFIVVVDAEGMDGKQLLSDTGKGIIDKF